MRIFLLILLTSLVTSFYSLAQKSYIISSGTKLIPTGSVKLVFGEGNLINHSDITDEPIDMVIKEPISYTGDGLLKVKNLEIDHDGLSSTLNNDIYVTGMVDPKAGSLNSNGHLIFKTIGHTPSIVGKTNCNGVNPHGAIIGEVVLERMIPGHARAFRLLSPGLNSTRAIIYNWQEGQNNLNTGSNLDSNPGYGTHITGSTSGANGFDASNTGSPSLFTFNASTQNWEPVTDTDQTLIKAGSAYRIFVRGSRAINLNSNISTSDDTILRTVGSLATCLVTFTSTGVGGDGVNNSALLSNVVGEYSFVGNPFWDYVDWHSIESTGLEETYYMWDPTLSSRGVYVSYNTRTGSSLGSLVDRYIQPGQAIYVKTSAVNPEISFKESSRTSNKNHETLIFSLPPNRVTKQDKLSVELQSVQSGKSVLNDGFRVIFSAKWSDRVGKEDSKKLKNPDENVALSHHGYDFSVEGRNDISFNGIDTLDMHLWNLQNKEYALNFDTKEFQNLKRIYFVDPVNGIQKEIAWQSTSSVTFTPANNEKEISRFKLLIVDPMYQYVMEEKPSSGLRISPNPAKDYVEIMNEGNRILAGSVLQVFSLDGQMTFKQTFEKEFKGSVLLDVQNYRTGTYILNLLEAEKMKVIKFLKVSN